MRGNPFILVKTLAISSLSIFFLYKTDDLLIGMPVPFDIFYLKISLLYSSLNFVRKINVWY